MWGVRAGVGNRRRPKRWAVILFIVFALSVTGCSAGSGNAGAIVGPSPLEGSGQLVVVTTDDWDATSGTLRRYERSGDDWEPVGEPSPVVVGRSGLGWGTGLHATPADGPRKQEGDGRAPAGAFLLTGVFGYAESGPDGLGYLHATPDLECVDDVESTHYNQVIDRSDTEVDWTSHEEMRRDDDLYRMGILVDHNNARVPGDGSCIFLHVWGGRDSTTSGCTAMPEPVIAEIAGWARSDERPILVQLPSAQYAQFQEAWMLP